MFHRTLTPLTPIVLIGTIKLINGPTVRRRAYCVEHTASLCYNFGNFAVDTAPGCADNMSSSYLRFALGVLGLVALSSLIAYQADTSRAGHLADPFAAGWMLSDTNGDEIIDFISGKVVLPAHPTAAQNAAAADLAARLGYATTGFTPPVVITRRRRPVGWPTHLCRAGRGAVEVLGCGGGAIRIACCRWKAAYSRWRTTSSCWAAMMPRCWPRRKRTRRAPRTSGGLPAKRSPRSAGLATRARRSRASRT